MILAGAYAAGQSPALNVDFGKVLQCYEFLAIRTTLKRSDVEVSPR